MIEEQIMWSLCDMDSQSTWSICYEGDCWVERVDGRVVATSKSDPVRVLEALEKILTSRMQKMAADYNVFLDGKIRTAYGEYGPPKEVPEDKTCQGWELDAARNQGINLSTGPYGPVLERKVRCPDCWKETTVWLDSCPLNRTVKLGCSCWCQTDGLNGRMIE